MTRERKGLVDALQNGVGTLISRIFIIFGIPALMSMGVWIGERMVTTLDKLIEKVEQQHEITVQSLNKLDVRLSVVETKQEQK